MSLTIDDLTISPDGVNRDTLLSNWHWAMEEPMLPVLITAMGDVFAQGESGAVYFLDVTNGSIEQVCQDGNEFQTSLHHPDFVTTRMYPGYILKFQAAGMLLDANEVYGVKHPLALGGTDDLENYEPTNVDVHISMHGQIHEQVKDLPPGTPINIQFEDP